MEEKRAALRFPTDLEANCQILDRSWASRLRNISTTGCMITLPEGTLPEDTALRIRIKGLASVDAEVVWQHRNHAGVRFRVPLHPAAMEHLGFVLPEGAWESAFRSTQRAALNSSGRTGEAPAQRTGGLNGLLVKRTTEPSEAAG